MSTEKISLADNSDKSLIEWPTLNDVCNTSKKPSCDGYAAKDVQNYKKCNKSSQKQNGYDSAKENDVCNGSSSRGARKKSSSKTKWVPVPIVAQPYKKRGNGRQFYDSNRVNERKNESNESNNSCDNGRGNARGNNRYRGKRGRSFSQNWRQRREETSRGEIENDTADLTCNAEYYYNNTAVYYDPYLHNAFAPVVRESELKIAVRLQIEYYFSEANLVTDIYLRKKMDNQGFAPVTMIAGFHRLRCLTSDMDLIISAITESSKLELVDNAKVRPVVDPLKWPIECKGVSVCKLKPDVPEFFPGQPYIVPVINSINNLTLNNDLANNFSQIEDGLSPDQVPEHFGDADNPDVNDVYYPESGSPHEHITNFYAPSNVEQYVTNGCDFYSHTPSPNEHINGFDCYSEQVSNNVLYYTPFIDEGEQTSNGVSYYYNSSPDEVLSTGTDNSVEDQQEILNNKSPEPTR